MKNPNYAIPEHSKFVNHFLSNYKITSNIRNLTAISQCYANYKMMGVFYSHDIMERIYSFDENFPIIANGPKQTKEIASELKPEPKIEREYYNPKNLAYAQSRVKFKFIKFVKASCDFHLSKIDTNTEAYSEELINKKITNDLKLNEFPISLFKENNSLLKFEEALKTDVHRESLEKFRQCYIQTKVVEASLLSEKIIISNVSQKLNQNVKFIVEKSQNEEEYQCEIIFNDKVLLGKGCNSQKRLAKVEAMKDFHNICVKSIDVNKYIGQQILNPPPEIESNSKLISVSEVPLPDGAVFNDLPFLKDFYLRNNRLSTAIGILQESFQYFKLVTTFNQTDDKIHFLVRGTVLASMNFCGNQSSSKHRIANFVLETLQKCKWTLMRNTLYINEFNESINVERNGLYERNLKDPTKMESSKNVGGQLMLKMGWDENAGLGKSGDGIKEPIINEMNAKRQGIGFDLGSSKNTKSFCNNVANALKNWMELEDDDLIFDRQFDNSERAMIHKECRKLGLLSKSYNNTNGDRFLVVSYCRNPKDLFDWIQSRGGKTKLYTLMPPGTLNCGVCDL